MTATGIRISRARPLLDLHRGDSIEDDGSPTPPALRYTAKRGPLSVEARNAREALVGLLQHEAHQVNQRGMGVRHGHSWAATTFYTRTRWGVRQIRCRLCLCGPDHLEPVCDVTD